MQWQKNQILEPMGDLTTVEVKPVWWRIKEPVELEQVNGRTEKWIGGFKWSKEESMDGGVEPMMAEVEPAMTAAGDEWHHEPETDREPETSLVASV